VEPVSFVELTLGLWHEGGGRMSVGPVYRRQETQASLGECLAPRINHVFCFKCCQAKSSFHRK
jgi:hypothetical protein